MWTRCCASSPRRVVLVHLDNYIGMGHNYYLYDDGGSSLSSRGTSNMVFGGFDSGLSDEQIFRFYYRRTDLGRSG